VELSNQLPVVGFKLLISNFASCFNAYPHKLSTADLPVPGGHQLGTMTHTPGNKGMTRAIDLFHLVVQRKINVSIEVLGGFKGDEFFSDQHNMSSYLTRLPQYTKISNLAMLVFPLVGRRGE
jgi:hypothetical protein